MEGIGVAGNVVAVLGLVVGILGLGRIVISMGDDARRTRGVRIVWAGMAITGVGIAIIMLSRPERILPFPVNLAFGLVFLLVSIRLAVSAATLRPPDLT